MSPGAANLFPFFSEENNPLYLDPSERAAHEQQGNRDGTKRTKREVLTGRMSLHYTCSAVTLATFALLCLT